MSEPESRKLLDLRVVDLRSELDKRNIERTGVKAVLIERLQKALEDEGHDPEEYLFQTSEKKIITPKRTRKGEGDDIETSEEDGKEEDSEGKLDSSNMDDDVNNKDNCVDNDKNKSCNDEDIEKLQEENNDEPELKSDKSIVEEEIANKDHTAKVEVGSDKKKESAANISMETNEGSKKEKKEVICVASKDNIERNQGDTMKQLLPKPKVLEIRLERTKVGSEIKEDKIVPEANGLDNEDSINLTIGEDEEKLLADEDDCCQEKDQKDEGRHPSATSTSSEPARKKKSTGESDAGGNNQEEKKEEAMKSGTGGVDRSTNKDDKGKKVMNSASTSGSSRNLWVSGLSTTTRATDLKQVFSKFGKVIGAKVVTNARTPGARCYGYVTMASSDDATKSIAQLHLTELHGRIILVERAKADSTGPPKRPEALKQIQPLEHKKPEERKKLRLTPTSSRSLEEKKKEEVLVPPGTECEKSVEVVVDSSSEPAAPGTEDPDIVCLDLGSGHQSRSKETGVVGVKVVAARQRSAASSHKSKERSPVRPPRKTSPQILSFQQIKEERERQRLQRKERELREEERRRKEERERQRETDRKQSMEAARLEREREKLRLEREKIERERAELLRLERDRLEREKEELNRQKLKLEEARRNKRALSGSREGFEDRKRSAPDRRYTQFTETTRGSDFKKEVRDPERVSGRREVSGSSRTRYEVEPPSRSRHEEPTTVRVREERIKESSRAFVTESRGERERSFRRGHEERTHTKPRERYDDSSKDVRFGGNAPEWHGGMKNFAPSSGSSSWVSGAVPRKPEPAPWSRPGPPPADSRSSRPKPWAPSPSSSDRWVSGSAPMSVGSRPGMSGPVMYPPPIGPGVPGMGMPLSNNGPYSGERFDAYKQQMGSMGRKY